MPPVHPSANGFHAVIRPHQSLPDPVFELAVSATLAISIAASVIANHIGLWPIGVSVGLTGLLTASLFVLWRADQDRFEDVRLCDGELCVRRYRKGRLVDQRRFGLDRTRLMRCDDPDYGCRMICLERRGSRFCIAADLSPAERDRFARGLVAAIKSSGRVLPVVSARAPALAD